MIMAVFNRLIWGNTVLLLLCAVRLSSSVSIDYLSVPSPIANGSASYAILDCEYSIDERDKDTLEVKWYFRYDPTPIFQWVPPGMPQVHPSFAKHVNLHYLVSDDPYTRHRALHLRRLSTQLSGRYSCKVSSIYQEDYQSKEMIIYQPSDKLHHSAYWTQNDQSELNITCSIKDVYPEPGNNYLFTHKQHTELYLVHCYPAEVQITLYGTGSDGEMARHNVTYLGRIFRSVEWTSRGLYSVEHAVALQFPLDIPISKHDDKSNNSISWSSLASPEGFMASCRFELPSTEFIRERIAVIPRRGDEWKHSSSSAPASSPRTYLVTVAVAAVTLRMKIANALTKIT